MEYHFDVPVSNNEIKKLNVGDIIYVSGKIFTARDEAHYMMLEEDKDSLDFNPSEMALFHCGPLMKKENGKWQVVSEYGINIIIGKGGMGERTEKALQKYTCVYTSYTGGAGALAADRVEEVLGVYWLDELSMPEAVWIFKVKDFGPLVVAVDSHGKSIYRDR